MRDNPVVDFAKLFFGLFALAILVIVSVYGLANTPGDSSPSPTDQYLSLTYSFSKSYTKKATPPVHPTKTPVLATSNQPSSPSSNPAPSTTPPHTGTSNNRSSGISYGPRPPTFPPFAISVINLYIPAWQCQADGSVLLYMSGAIVVANSPIGGSFTWQFDFAGPKTLSTPPPQAVTMSQWKVQTMLTGKGPDAPPGDLFYDGDAVDGEAVRVHVTSPNDIVSDWLSVPVGTEQSCQNN